MATRRLLAEEFMSAHPDEAARILLRFTPAEAAVLLEEGRPEASVSILQSMEPLTASECLSCSTPEALARILPVMPRETTLRLVRLMGEESRGRVLDLAPEEIAKSLQLLLRYPEGTAGALMDPQFVVVSQELRVAEVRRRLKLYIEHSGYYLYVEDRDHQLVGALSVRQLMRAKPDELLSSWTHRPVARLSARTPKDAVAAHPGWRLYHCLPVVDEVDGREVPVGVIRYGTLRVLEAGTITPHHSGILRFALALGEMYWIGSAGLLGGLEYALRAAPSRAQERLGTDGT